MTSWLSRGARRRRAGEERGQAMAELALVMPILLLVLAGILHFGRVFNYWIDTTHITNDTARWVAVDRVPGASAATAASVISYVCSQTQTNEQRATIQVRLQYDTDNDGLFSPPATPAGSDDETLGGTLDIGEPIRVQIRRNVFAVPYFNQFPITLTSSATMRVESMRGSGGSAPATYAPFTWTSC